MAEQVEFGDGDKSSSNTIDEVVYVVDEETATIDFDRFCDECGIKPDFEKMKEEDIKSFDETKDKIVLAIRLGSALINDDGNLVYTLLKPLPTLTKLTFEEPLGSSYMAMDRFKDQQTMRKTFAFMGDSTHQDIKLFSQMANRDLKFCMGVSALFLGS